jgi:hypothetical protein
MRQILRVLVFGLHLAAAANLAFAQKQSSEVRVRPTYTALAFYVAGHADDWELFRGNAAYDDLEKPDTKVVFIYGTGGDADDGRMVGSARARRRRGVRAAIGRPAQGRRCPIRRSPDYAIHVPEQREQYFLRLPDGKTARW